MKIYVASSWRNLHQPVVVQALRKVGHDVYDFRNPPRGTGFAWGQIDHDWKLWDTSEYVIALQHPVAQAGFKSDMDALREADCCVLVLPSGRSAHLEAGYAIGRGKPTFIYSPEVQEPELMNLMAQGITNSLAEVLQWVEQADRELGHLFR